MLPNVIAPDSGVQHQEENCKININLQNEGSGTLYISEARLIWANAEGRGISLGYKDIAIHAISKDLQAFPEECLYVMYNGEVMESVDAVMNGNGHREDSEEEDDQSATISEIRFVPQCRDNLKKMFDAMSDCQCLHPDSEDSDDYYESGEGDGAIVEGLVGAEYPPIVYDDSGAADGFYTSEEGFQHLTPAGQATLERLENMLAQSHVSEPEQIYPEMEGVIIEEDEKPNPDEPPAIGRPRVMDNGEPMNNCEPEQPSVDGQFDDA